jgi:hypothetical protein
MGEAALVGSLPPAGEEMTDSEKLVMLMEELIELERTGHDLLPDADGYLTLHVDGCHGCLANDILTRLFEAEMIDSLSLDD